MSHQELLIRIVRILDDLGIDYMLTGSLASSLQGEPRSTHDIDLVVSFPEDRMARFVSRFPGPDYYVDADAIRQAIVHRHMFNVIAVSDGIKVDFWMLTTSEFDMSRFERKETIEFEGARIKVSSPEDTILMKLHWAALAGGSQKQFIDAMRVYEVQYGHLDMNYLTDWIDKLGHREIWTRLVAQSRTIVDDGKKESPDEGDVR